MWTHMSNNRGKIVVTVGSVPLLRVTSQLGLQRLSHVMTWNDLCSSASAENAAYTLEH